MNNNTWLILDADFLCHRAYHSTGGLSYKGKPTGVIYGFLKALIQLQQQFDTSNVVFCFDSRDNFRKAIYPKYKAKRQVPQTKEQELEQKKYREQVKALRMEILPAIGFRNIAYQRGYESDDMIAVEVWRISHRAVRSKAFIVTADHDLYQCITSDVSVYNPSTAKTMDLQHFEREYKIDPRGWITVKTLAGCTSDNIPGVPGVGEITALKWMRGEKIGEKVRQRIETYVHNDKFIHRNSLLVTLPYPGAETVSTVVHEVTKKAWRDVCKKLGFSSLRLEYPKGAK